MNDSELNRAVAERLGMTFNNPMGAPLFYATSLDAMREAEATLSDAEQTVYVDAIIESHTLGLMQAGQTRPPDQVQSLWLHLTTPARVRAECFLRATEGRASK